MKKIQLLLAAVILVAGLSAFATREPVSLYFRHTNGEFYLKNGGGSCESGSYYCGYLWSGNGNPNDVQDPDNYEPFEDPGQWVPCETCCPECAK